MKLVKEAQVSEDLQYHLDENLALAENVFRAGSSKFFEIFNEARALYKEGALEISEDDKFFLEETFIGEVGIYEGQEVYLDFPLPTKETFEEAKYQGRKVDLNKPTRSNGPKKFQVYTKNPKTGKVIKVSFGASDGGGALAVKLKDSERRKAFADRHNCEKKNDRTKAGYWSCRLPRYAKALGLSGAGGRWW